MGATAVAGGLFMFELACVQAANPNNKKNNAGCLKRILTQPGVEFRLEGILIDPCKESLRPIVRISEWIRVDLWAVWECVQIDLIAGCRGPG